MNPESMTVIAECRALTSELRQKRGTLVGIACKTGRFAVTETRKEGRKSITEHLTGWQSHAECVQYMRGMVV